jgi:hypothetical protein
VEDSGASGRGTNALLVLPCESYWWAFGHTQDNPENPSDFIWKGMDRDVRERVKHCQTCAASKPAQTNKFGFLESKLAERPLQRLFVDYVGRSPRSKIGNTMLLVCEDGFIKFVWLFPV